MFASSYSSPPLVPSWERLVSAFDAELAQPEIEGIPIGSTLTDILIVDYINGGGRWGMAQRWLDGLRWWKRYFHAPRGSEDGLAQTSGRILVTWRSSTSRVDELILPMLQALTFERCTVVYENSNVLQRLPLGVDSVDLKKALCYDRRNWLAAFRRCWPQWRSRVYQLSKSFGLPRGVADRLALCIIVNSQMALGCLDFLKRCRPAAVVTDYDRARLSSCLVLAAASLGIPTFSLQHGVMGENAVGYVPVLADKMFCWSELHRTIVTEAGQNPANLAIGGCPRLTRAFSVDPQSARKRLQIDPLHRVAMLGTSPAAESQKRLLTEWFCRAVKQLDGVKGIVRLHPSESLDFYRTIADDFPEISFIDNAQVSLDESLAACDVVVVQRSGLGSDALIKGRLVVVVDLPDEPLGHGQKLIERAGCPRAASVEELAASLRNLLFDDAVRIRHFAAAQPYVEEFCAYFGRESAEKIAEEVNRVIGVRSRTATPDRVPESVGQKTKA